MYGTKNLLRENKECVEIIKQYHHVLILIFILHFCTNIDSFRLELNANVLFTLDLL